MPPKHRQAAVSGGPETKKRRALSLHDKLEIIKLAEENPNLKHEDIAVRYGCGRSTISNVLREKEKWQKDGREGALRQREAQWVNNKKAWMTQNLFEEWLVSTNNYFRIQNRKVLLSRLG